MIAKEQVNNKMGRPRVPEYRNKLHRMGKVEDKFIAEVIPFMKNIGDRELVLKALEDLKK